MIIERTKNEVIFKLPYNTDIDLLQDLADLFEYNEITRKSKATKTQVDQFLKSLKKGRWKKTKKEIGL
jgi:hypothetical protein